LQRILHQLGLLVKSNFGSIWEYISIYTPMGTPLSHRKNMAAWQTALVCRLPLTSGCSRACGL